MAHDGPMAFGGDVKSSPIDEKTNAIINAAKILFLMLDGSAILKKTLSFSLKVRP